MRSRFKAGAVGVVAGVLGFGLLVAIAQRLGLASVSLPRLASAAPWSTSRATGAVAYLTLTLDVLVGLGLTTRAGDRWPGRAAAVALHTWLSPLALGLVAAHAAALLANAYIGFDVIDLVVSFASSYRPVAVGVGVLAAYAALLVHASFALRGKLGHAWWRRLHALSFVAYVLATAHGLTAGTDAQAVWARAMYAISTTLVIGLLVRRGVGALSARASGFP